MGGFSGSSQSSSSEPKDLTPEEFKALRQPFADVFAQLLGFQRSPTQTQQAPQQTSDPFWWIRSASGEGDMRLMQPGEIAPGTTGQFATTGGDTGDFRGGGAFRTGGAGGSTFPGGSGFEATGDPTNVLRGIPTHEGPFAAGLASGEQSILQQLLGQSSSGPGFGDVRDFLGRTMAGEFLPGSEGGGNPFLQSAIEAAQRPTLQGLEETLSRTLPGRFTAAGQFTQPEGSSAFDRAAGIATRGVAQELGDIASRMSFAGFESERGRQQEAAQALPGVAAQEVNTLVQNLQAQALPRLIEQAGIEGGIEQFNRQIQNLLQVLAIAQGTTAPAIGNESESSGRSLGLNIAP